jgi:hypothetical protein
MVENWYGPFQGFEPQVGGVSDCWAELGLHAAVEATSMRASTTPSRINSEKFGAGIPSQPK